MAFYPKRYFGRRYGGVTSVVYNSVDVSRGFEVDSDPSGWVETDTGSLFNRFDSAQYKSGTHSASVANSATTVAYQQYDIGSSKSAVNVCFWFYLPSIASSDSIPICSLSTATSPGGTNMCRAYVNRVTGAGAGHFIRFRGLAYPAGVVNYSTSAWYRIEIQAVQNSSSVLTVYDAGGTLLETISISANNNACRYVSFGRTETATTTLSNPMYFDDIGIAWTGTPAYPLWPYLVSN